MWSPAFTTFLVSGGGGGDNTKCKENNNHKSSTDVLTQNVLKSSRRLYLQFATYFIVYKKPLKLSDNVFQAAAAR